MGGFQKENGPNFSEKRMGMKNLLLISILVWIFFSVWLWVVYPLEPSQSQGFRYLLSALSQGIAALFGLVFTVPLVISQLVARYSYRPLGYMFLPLIPYSIPFVATIILSLLFIPSPDPMKVKVCLTFGAFSFATIFPYLRAFLARLSPSSLVEFLAEKALKKLRSGKDPEEIEEIKALDNMAVSALSLKDYDTFASALEKIEVLLIEGEAFKTLKHRFHKLYRMPFDDPYASSIGAEALASLGKKAAEIGMEEVRKWAFVEGLIEGFMEAVGEGKTSVATSIVSAAADLERYCAEHLVKEKVKDLSFDIVFLLGILCASAVENNLWKPAFEATLALLHLGTEAYEKGEEKIVEYVAQELRKVKKKGELGEKVVRDAVAIQLAVDTEKTRAFLKKYLPDVARIFGL